jgi:hypothetical protein
MTMFSEAREGFAIGEVEVKHNVHIEMVKSGRGKS